MYLEALLAIKAFSSSISNDCMMMASASTLALKPQVVVN
jgi:hypothetical protein